MTRQATSSRRKTRRRSKPKRPWRTAKTSDPLELYEKSVQEPEAEGDLIDLVWKERRRRVAHHIREDFCGSAAVAMEWVKRRRANTSVGVDIDEDVLEWARERIPERLKPAQRKRLTLKRADVRRARVGKVDSVLAMNFSYFIFKTRRDMLGYFRSVRRSLVRDGLFLLDAYGGSESFTEMTEDRNFDGFTYVWDQNHYNPITGDAVNYIHFEFPDGSKLRRAFKYEWRLWTIPELRDILLDAGFKNVSVYWEGTTRSGEGDGIFTLSTEGEACEGWIAYLVAEK